MFRIFPAGAENKYIFSCLNTLFLGSQVLERGSWSWTADNFPCWQFCKTRFLQNWMRVILDPLVMSRIFQSITWIFQFPLCWCDWWCNAAAVKGEKTRILGALWPPTFSLGAFSLSLSFSGSLWLILFPALVTPIHSYMIKGTQGIDHVLYASIFTSLHCKISTSCLVGSCCTMAELIIF